MDEISENFNNLIASGDIKQLIQIKEKMKNTGLQSSIVNCAILLAEKYQKQMLGSLTRRIPLNIDEHTNPHVQQEIRIRRVFLPNVELNSGNDIKPNRKRH